MLIVLVGFVIYANSIQVPFVFDDVPSIVDNHTIKSPWPNLDWLSPPDNIINRPITNLTLAINYAVSRQEVWSYHALNLLNHLFAGLLLFGIIRRTAVYYIGSQGTTDNLAMFCTLIWLSHPLQTQAVTYIIQRCESLMGMLVFLTLYCAMRGWQSGHKRRWHMTAVLSCTLGMGVKEGMAVTPLLIIIYDMVFNRRCFRKSLGASRLLYTGLTLSLVVLAIIVFGGGSTKSSRDPLPFDALDYLITQSEVIAHYIRLSVWPDDLVIFYCWPIARFRDVIPYVVVLSVLLALTIWALAKRRPLSYPAIWFFITLAPASSVIPIKHAIFEHRMYLPLAGLSALATFGSYAVIRRLSTKYPVILFITGGLLVASLGMRTFWRNADYGNPLTLWATTHDKQKKKCLTNGLVENGIGHALLEAGRIDEAMYHFSRAIELEPDNAVALNNLGISQFRKGNFEKARQYYNKAFRKRSSYPVPYMNLGVVFVEQGEMDLAISSFQKALQLNPYYVAAHYNLSLAYEKTGRLHLALSHLEHAVALDPGDLQVRLELGLILSKLNRSKEAFNQIGEVLRESPDYPGAQKAFGFMLLAINLNEEAISTFKRAIDTRPDDVNAHNGLAVAFTRAGRTQEAIRTLQKALLIDPENEETLKHIKILKPN